MRTGILLIMVLLLLSSLSLAQLPDIPDVGPGGCVELGPDGNPVPCTKGTTKRKTKESVYDKPIYFTSEGSICYDGITGKKKPWEECKIRPLGGVPGNEPDVDDEPEPKEKPTEPQNIKPPAEEKKPTRTAPLIRIGATAAVDGEWHVIRVDGTRERITSSGFTLNHNDRLISGSKSRMQVLLLDGTVFTMGPNTELVLDDFVYDPNTDLGKITANLIKGGFRFVTGKVARKDPSKVKIRVPVGTIGFRGTDVIVSYDEVFNTVALHVHEGEVDITTDAGVDIISAGKSITFDETGIITEEDLTKDYWESLIEQFTVEKGIGLVIFFILFVVAIIASIYFIVKRGKDGKKKSKLAISSFILSIFSLLLGWIPFLGWIFIILTLVFGFMALNQIKIHKLSGRRLAIAGIILGFISLMFALIVIIGLLTVGT